MLTGLPGSSRSHMQLWAPAAPTIPAGPQTNPGWLLFFPSHPHLQHLAHQKPARAKAPFAALLDLAGLGHSQELLETYHSGALLYYAKKKWISSCMHTPLRALRT